MHASRVTHHTSHTTPHVAHTLASQEHDRFIRKGDDLLTEKSITLAQALCGAEVRA